MITAFELRKCFPSADGDVVAVNGLSFEVGAGEIYGLLGPNGAGKTTTLRMVLGLMAPTSGDASVGGHSVSQAPDEVKRRVGFVSAGVGVYPWLTPHEVLSFVADLYGVRQSVASDRVRELAELLDFRTILNRRCGTLSTGQRQRVNLARALIHDPPVILMDEPTRGLDVVLSQVIFEYIDHVRAIGKAVIVSTHRLDEAERLCDRFGLLHEGILRQEGRLAELRMKTGRENLTEMFLDFLHPERREEPV